MGGVAHVQDVDAAVMEGDAHGLQGIPYGPQYLLDVIRADHGPHSFPHLIQDVRPGFVVLALGDVAGHAVGADVVLAAVESAGADGKVADIHLHVAGVSDPGVQANFHAPGSAVTGAAFVKGATQGVDILGV